MQVLDSYDEYPYTEDIWPENITSKGSGMSTYMLSYMMGNNERRKEILDRQRCKTCMYYRRNEGVCIKYSPCLVDTTDNDDCDAWELRK